MTTRIFQPMPLKSGETVLLDEKSSHHLIRVLRIQVGEKIILFNGEGGEFESAITAIQRKYVEAVVGAFNPREAESPLWLHLAQGIPRGEKMDYLLQKAVELGVNAITPLLTARCTVKMDGERMEKRIQRWRAIIISACEQCGRNRIPEIFPAMKFSDWLENMPCQNGFVLDPEAASSVKTTIADRLLQKATLLAGPEGGLTADEIAKAKQSGLIPLSLGPRILRTETAGLAAITAFQCLAGDIG